jgi:hypothetical protein
MGFGLGGSAKIKVDVPKVEVPKVEIKAAAAAGVAATDGVVASISAKAKAAVSAGFGEDIAGAYSGGIGAGVGTGDDVVSDNFAGDAEDIPMQPHTVMDSWQPTDKVEVIYLGEW